MRIRSLTYILLVSLLWSVGIKAQNGNPLQFFPDYARASQFDPSAVGPQNKLVIGLPYLSGNLLDWDANFSLDYIFASNFDYSFANFYEKLDRPGKFFSISQIPLFYAGLQEGKQNFSFTVNDKILFASQFDRELLKFIDNGILPYFQNDQEFGPASLIHLYYREFAFGYSNAIGKKGRFGIRPKILFARFLYDVPNIHLQVTSETEPNFIHLTPLGSYTLSGPVKISYNETTGGVSILPNPRPEDYILKFKNMGAAIDLGFTYELPQTRISVSMLNLGFLGFKSDTYDITFTGSMDFPEEQFFQSSNSKDLPYVEPKYALIAYSDSIPYLINAVTATKSHHKMPPLTFNALIDQTLSSKQHLVLSFQYSRFDEFAGSYFSTAFRQQIGNKFDLAASACLFDWKELRPGIGLLYTAASTQWHFACNNMVDLTHPLSAKRLNLSLGLHFLFPTKN